MNDFLKDHPGVKLNEWSEETVEIPVMTPQVNEESGRVEFKKENQKIKQKTMYVDTPAKMIVCGKDHVYDCLDRGKYIFKCRNCDWHKIALPITFRFDPETGILTYRENGVRA